MKGILVYTREDAVVNRWFVGHLIEISVKFGAELSLVIHNDSSAFDGGNYADVDFCINRSRLNIVNEVMEAQGIPCFNNYRTVDIANDKYKTYLLCKELGVPVMETCLYSKEVLQNINFPCVLKSVNGHGGQEVFLLEKACDAENLTLSDDKDYILQELSSQTGVDVRVYVLGGKPVAAVRRSSAENFRSNYSLGGKAEVVEIEPEQIEMISALQTNLGTDYAGFDFIQHEGRWVLNEIEDAVGSRMLYTLCNCDAGEEYLRYIFDRINSEK